MDIPRGPGSLNDRAKPAAALPMALPAVSTTRETGRASAAYGWGAALLMIALSAVVFGLVFRHEVALEYGYGSLRPLTTTAF